MSADDDAGIRARLAAIVDSSYDAILAKDLDGIVTAWNPAAQRLYGYTPHEIVGRSINTIIPDELVGESAYILGEVVAGRSVSAHDTERVTKSGRRVPVSIVVSPIRDAAGTVIGASTIARDIAERLAAEADRARNEMLVDQSADAIMSVGADGLIDTWNPAAERLFGYSAQEAIGRLPQEVVHADDDQEQAQVTESVMDLGQTRHYEAHRRNRDGDPLILDVSVAPLQVRDGHAQGAVVAVRDVTAARAAEARIREAELRQAELTQELEQTRRLESVGQLAGGIAHDFNNLLAVILNLAGFVADDLPEDSAARADADEIVLTAKRAAALTRQLLIFSRRDVTAPEIFNPSEVVGSLGEFLRRALGERVRVEVETDPELWKVEMDRGQLEQIIVNLAVNGRDAMEGAGRLVIETRNTVVDAEFARTRVGLEPGDYVTLTISDTGSGMEAAVVERAFEPFFTTKPKGQGTGLGLATVYGIVSRIGGRVAIYSEPGRGTSVKVHLPATVAVARAATALLQPTGPGRGERVLVVEDAGDVRSIAQRILTRGGYAVGTAASGVEALEMIAAGERFDLLLTDVVMPGMTGTELAAAVRSREPEAKVLYMSGYSYALLTDEILGDPGSGFLEKPFTADELRRRVRDLLDGASAAGGD